MTTENMPATGPARTHDTEVIKRHSIATRLWHWINALCLLVLLMSGLQIFNAHPALYWGEGSHFQDPVLSIGAKMSDGQPMGFLAVDGHQFTTTGVLGWSSFNGQMQARAFPAWATLPDTQWLSLGRQWHFTAAWVFGVLLVGYLVYSLISRRRRGTILPRGREFREIPHTVIEHAKLRFPRVRNYNIVQKFTYLLVLFILLPGMVLTGLTLSPTMDAAWPWLLTLFGGHQSARTLHFIFAFSLVGFFIVHLLLVLLSGVFNNMRSMLTGGYRVNTSADNAHDSQANHE
ncbi:MAG: cytochrome b/b6 domain-containing protein [Salinisphaera sp.]|jgi:thiosulfate reductase cytochrome b subunit|nr:cytochrome b/b6 domain-containing protein [Salinisphaera sp.]